MMIVESDQQEWNRWYEKFVQPIFVPSEHESYYAKIKRLQTPFFPKYWIAEKFYNKKVKDDNRFDDELKKYFSFLYSCGFFMDNILTFEEWLNVKNWENPSNENINSESILEILQKDGGVYELKRRLRWLPFLNRQDGF
ncbi:hypothetical protein [Tenacibaculum sp. UWU-22]|uniref:hypothetical protein n=1 Tax=Tenacibaculum sp. UWU-22 TaxID=3234187 RepID=UPI0034DB3D28